MPNSFSIIVPVKKFTPNLRKVILTINGQIFQENDIEVIIVQNSKNLEPIPDFFIENARVIQVNKPSRSLARNIGAQAATKTNLLFLDDNSLLPRKNLLLTLSKLCNLKVVQLSINQVSDSQKESIYQQFERMLYYRATDRTWNVALNGPCLDTAGLMINRKFFLEFGGFDLAYDRYEDREFAKRLYRSNISVYAAKKIFITKVIENTTFANSLKNTLEDQYYYIQYWWSNDRKLLFSNYFTGLLNLVSPKKVNPVTQGQASFSVMILATIIAAIKLSVFPFQLLFISLSRNPDSNYTQDWVTKEIKP